MPPFPSALRSPRGERDYAELGIFLALALLSVWTLGLLLHRVLVNGNTWTGSDGLHVSDQMQYLAWIREASRHLLIANPYELTPTPATFLHPGFLLSGALTALGLAPSLAYLLWAPVALVSLFLAVRAYVGRTVHGVAARRAALVLALFFVSTAAYVSGTLGVHPNDRLYLLALGYDMWPGSWLWGYSFTVLAVAAVPAALLLYQRDREARRVGLAVPAIGALCSWFQPWQGATLLGILVVTEGLLLVSRRVDIRGRLPWSGTSGAQRPAPVGLLAVIGGATAAPLIYYALLGQLDPSWALANMANKLPAWPLWTILATIAPLALPAALAYRLPPATFQDLAVRSWPVVALALYWLSAYAQLGTFPIHFFQGLTIPLAILAVTGVQAHVRLRRPFATVAAVGIVAVLTVPAVAWQMNAARQSIDAPAVSSIGPPNPYFLTHGEAQALQYVKDDKREGGVLTPLYLGQLIPAETGKPTWVGAVSWTPHFADRVALAERLFNGVMTRAQSIAFVRSTAARYVVVDCQHHANVASLLAPIVQDERRFGCASVLSVAAG